MGGGFSAPIHRNRQWSPRRWATSGFSGRLGLSVAEIVRELGDGRLHIRLPWARFNASISEFLIDFMDDSVLEIDKTPLPSDRLNWIEAQDSLKRRLVLDDEFLWTLHAKESCESNRGDKLQYVGGVDISFSKDDPNIACGALVIVNIDDLCVVYNNFAVVKLQIPYIPGFLAFREAPVLLELLKKMKRDEHPFYPQILMVDGNGLLHPRGFGLACHLGVLANIPTIGVGKNLHHVDGLTQSGVRQLLKAKPNCSEDRIPLTGNSGRIWGVAMRSTESSSKPIFISIGHRISLETAIAVVKLCCKYRVPEPIRQADIRSRAYLQKHGTMF